MPRRPPRATRFPYTTLFRSAAIGPYSQAVRAGEWLFVSGQIPLDPATGQLVDGGVTAQAERAFRNLQAVVERSEEHTSELQSRPHLVCRLLLEKKNHAPRRA